MLMQQPPYWNCMTDEVTEMNIGTLSASAHTSNAAVVRLCRKLGLDGYRDGLRDALDPKLKK